MQIKYFNFFVDAGARKIFDFIYAELFVPLSLYLCIYPREVLVIESSNTFYHLLCDVRSIHRTIRLCSIVLVNKLSEGYSENWVWK